MSDVSCRYAGNRDQAIVSYLYGESRDWDPADRAAFEAHLPACAECLAELAGFEDVRSMLGHWAPPERSLLTAADAVALRPWWREIPAWAQVAAAMVFLGVGAGIANLDVRYDANGLRIRTGWSPPATAASVTDRAPVRASAVVDASSGDNRPWRADLTSLEQRLRADLASPAKNSVPSSNDVLRRAGNLVAESERRQQRELALRLGELMRDVNAQRTADLVKIERSLGTMQNNTGLEMLRQRETLNSINSYLVRTSSQQRPQ